MKSLSKNFKLTLLKVANRLRQEAFAPTVLAVIISPIFFIRRGLYKCISSFAQQVRGEILDFGCGSKPYESLFTNASGYTGIDIAVSGHDHAFSRVDCFYDGKNLPFKDGSFNAVVSFEVIEHIFNIDEVLQEISRVLKPNGLLLISIPFAWVEHEIPYDFARYSSFGIRHILEKNGFEIVESQKTTTSFIAISQLAIFYLNRHVLPNGRVFGKLFQLLLIFPLNAIILVLNFFLPKRYDFYCNNVILARKIC